MRTCDSICCISFCCSLRQFIAGGFQVLHRILLHDRSVAWLGTAKMPFGLAHRAGSAVQRINRALGRFAHLRDLFGNIIGGFVVCLLVGLDRIELLRVKLVLFLQILTIARMHRARAFLP